MSTDRTTVMTNAILKGLLTDTVSLRSRATNMDITESGIYHVTVTTTGIPKDVYGYGTLIVFDGATFKAQIYIPHHQGNCKYTFLTRGWYDGKWAKWYGHVGLAAEASTE